MGRAGLGQTQARGSQGQAAWWGYRAEPRGDTCRDTGLESPNCCCMVEFFFLILFFCLFSFLKNCNWRLITILGWFFPYIHKNQPWVYMYSPSCTPLPPPSLFLIYGT